MSKATGKPPAHPVLKSQGRLGFLDWSRGLAALIMLQGHVFHSFTAKELREGAPYVLSQFLGGMPPAIFLFLTGITLAFLMDSCEQKGLAPAARIMKGLRRAGYLLVLALLFRLQLWIFGLPTSPWTDLLRVDILNAMALALAVMAPMALFRTAERVRHCAVLGIAIAAASPLVSMVNWSAAPGLLRAYLAPDTLSFGFFPWASFVAFGVSAGSILRLAPRQNLGRVMEWGALLGFGLIVGGRYFAGLPYSLYPASEFWLNSPALILIKLGVILLLLAFAFLWNEYGCKGWSWIRQFGVTSLLVYWVHTELVYGRWLWAWKESLGIGATVALAVLVIGAMLGLSVLKTRWSEVKTALLLRFPAADLSRARAVSGD